MGILSTGSFCHFSDFLNGKYDHILNKAGFSLRSKSAKNKIEICDLVITADTETSHQSTGSDIEYFEPPEVSYLRGLKIKCPESIKKDFSDFQYIKRKAFGLKLYLGQKGHDIEELYSELVRLYGWDRTLINPSDKLMDIIDFLDDERDRRAEYAAGEDIEVGWVYQWCICIYDSESPLFIYGRLPSDMTACFEHISTVLDLNDKRRASVYFHNFSYDYQYLKRFIERDLDAGASPGDEFRLLATAPHKIISWNTTSGITFKCSYRLANASLDFWTKKIIFTRYKKLVGAVDYDIIRYQDTPLNRQDWRYMFYDVLCQAEAIYKTAGSEKDNMATIPLTSTGYVRRDGRKYFKKEKSARKEFQKSRLTPACYKVLKSAQAGGYTHTNRFIAGRTLDIKSEEFKHEYPEIKDIRHGDMRSFYPSMQMCERYPIGPFIKYYKKPPHEVVSKCLNDHAHCYLFVVCFTGGHIKQGVVFPIISGSKAWAGKVSPYFDLVEDNGRVLKATGQYILALTELDFKIVLKQYDFEKIQIIEIWRSRAGFLPAWMRGLICQYFKGKTDLKIKSKENPGDETILSLLMKDKNKVNGIYGMTATDIVRDSFYEDECGEWIRKEADIPAELDKYYRNGNSFMRLQWGVWCTSWARYRLIELADIIGSKYVLYSDTDSIFYLSNDEIEGRVKAWNDEHYKRAIEYNNYIEDSKGKIITFDVFEDEGENIIKFRALHSKCYAYVTADDKLHVTVAGVNKHGRAEELNDIDNLENNFTFHKCGGTSIKYFEDDITQAELDGHKLEHAGSAILFKVDKTIKHNPYDFTDDSLFLPMEEDELIR